MRSLILIDKMPIAGSQRHVARLALGLSNRGIDVSICCLGEIGAEGEKLLSKGIEVLSLGCGNIVSGLGLRAWHRLLRLMETHRPDILHTILFDANLVGPLAAAAMGRRPAVIASRRDTGFALRFYHRWPLRLANRFVDVFCANSAAVRQAMVAGEGIAAERIRVIPNGVDAAALAAGNGLRRALGLADDDFVVLCVARLRREKGHDALLRAAALLKDERPAIKLLLAGNGPEEGRLRQLANALGLSACAFFLGERLDIPDLLATADAVALLSTSEGFANAVLEAMAAGKAVVASDVGGNSEAICHETTGLLVPPACPEAAAAALRRLRDHPALRERLAAAARARAISAYGLEREIDDYQHLYEEMWQRRRQWLCWRQDSLPRHLALICSQFPRYDETFILREIKALASRSRVDILSLRRCRDRIVHEAAKTLQSQTHYLPWLLSCETIAACLVWLWQRPLVVLNQVAFCLQAMGRAPLEALKSLAVLPKAMAFARRLARAKPDLVHGFWATFPAVAAKAAADLLDVAWGFSAHAHDIFQSNALLSEKLHAADACITCTDYNRTYLAALAPSAAAKIRLVYHGIDTDRFAPSAAARASNAIRLLCVGSFLPCKGMATLIQAAAILRQRQDVRVILVGDGPEQPHLAKTAAQLGIAAEVIFAGYTTEENMPAQYQQADIFILPLVPRIHWGIPNVVLEAMVCGLPTVVTALPSLKAVFSDKEIVFLDAPQGPTAEQVAEAVQRLVDDAAERARLASAGRKKVVALFDHRRCADALWEAFAAACRRM